MPLQRSAWMYRGVALLVLLLYCTFPVFAQSDDDDKPWFDVPTLELQKPYVQWLFGSLFVALCLLVAFKNPHRSHLD